jgi:hypothetical protein
MPKTEEDWDLGEYLTARKFGTSLALFHRDLRTQDRNNYYSAEAEEVLSDSVDSACMLFSMNVFSRHSGLVVTVFFFNSIIQRERSICLFLFVTMNAIGILFHHLLNTITVYKGNYKS